MGTLHRPLRTRATARLLCVALATAVACTAQSDALPTSPPPSAGLDTSWAARLQRTLDSAVRTAPVRGVSAAVILGNGTEWGGTAGLSEPGTAMAPAMRLGIGSISKNILSALLVRQAERGLLSLDDPLSRWLPPIAQADPAITVRQLLNHTSGVFDITTAPGYRDSILANVAARWTPQRTLALLLITHPHIDHVRGIPMLLSEFHVQNVVDNGRDGDDLVKAEMAALRSYTQDGSVGYRGINTSDILKKNGFTDSVVDPFVCAQFDPVVRVLSGAFDVDPGWGTDNYGHLLFDNMNNHSVVVRVDAGNASILVTGDLEKIAIAGLLKRYRATRWLDVDVLQVGHHGSVNGTTREMLAVTTPQVALIAAGSPSRQHSWTAWAYGHPRAEVVDLLQENVSNRRGRIEVNAGKSAKRFVQRMVDRAIYSTAWEGSVDVDLGIDGSIVTHVAR